jgi:hypothetical protein
MKFDPWFHHYTCYFFLFHHSTVFPLTRRVEIVILAKRTLLIWFISNSFRSRTEICFDLVSTSTPNRILHKFEIFGQSDLVAKNLSSFILFKKSFDSWLNRCNSGSANCEYLFSVWLLENRIIFCFKTFGYKSMINC